MSVISPQSYPQAVRLGLVGKGIQYSKSPFLHNTWIKQRNMVGLYDLIDCDVFDHSKVLELVSKGYCGVNVTIPHKTSAAQLATVLDDVVQGTGGANCLKFDYPTIKATNTDALALYYYLKPYSGLSRAVIIGTGATARTSVWVLKKLGVDNIVFLSRSKQDHQTFLLKDLSKHVLSADILINASPWGMNDELCGVNISSSSLLNVKCVIDWVYTPLNTYLLACAQEEGVDTINGMSLLTKQAELSWDFWEI